jgi:H+/gluconate symporter-like permease
LVSAEIISERVNKKLHIALLLIIVALAIALITRTRLRKVAGPAKKAPADEPSAEA